MRRKCVKHHNEDYKACAFSVFLLVTLVSGIVFAFNSAGPIVLGTELNGNGSVEYLCLGNGCENLKTMDW